MKLEIVGPKTFARSERSSQYGDAFRQFCWGYAVDALPRTLDPLWRRGARWGDDILTHLMSGVLKNLEERQGNQVYYACVLETGRLGGRHLHALLGNLSRLTPKDVERVFHAKGFGATKVKLWNPGLHNGYYFKSIDEGSLGHDQASWDSNVIWNRNCKQRMRLMRRHLDKMMIARWAEAA